MHDAQKLKENKKSTGGDECEKLMGDILRTPNWFFEWVLVRAIGMNLLRPLDIIDLC